MRRREENRKLRSEPEEVRDMLFKAFEKHQYYTIKDLADITRQPIVLPYSPPSSPSLPLLLSTTNPPAHLQQFPRRSPLKSRALPKIFYQK